MSTSLGVAVDLFGLLITPERLNLMTLHAKAAARQIYSNEPPGTRALTYFNHIHDLD